VKTVVVIVVLVVLGAALAVASAPEQLRRSSQGRSERRFPF
jgi:hypothetical protein